MCSTGETTMWYGWELPHTFWNWIWVSHKPCEDYVTHHSASQSNWFCWFVGVFIKHEAPPESHGATRTVSNSDFRWLYYESFYAFQVTFGNGRDGSLDLLTTGFRSLKYFQSSCSNWSHFEQSCRLCELNLCTTVGYWRKIAGLFGEK
jgi:hypothetical protein